VLDVLPRDTDLRQQVLLLVPLHDGLTPKILQHLIERFALLLADGLVGDGFRPPAVTPQQLLPLLLDDPLKRLLLTLIQIAHRAPEDQPVDHQFPDPASDQLAGALGERVAG
jgi:hypothetical protein